MSLLTELRRRNVIRMAGLYLVAAWLITQVAGTVLPMFGAPAWLPRSVVILPRRCCTTRRRKRTETMRYRRFRIHLELGAQP